MLIEHVRIKNFRSLKDLEIHPSHLTVLVGSNDEGKSNVLRALDLFFNHERLGEHQLDWHRDYCAFATKKIRKAEQIEMSLTLRLPENYSLTEALIWTKIWRKEGFYEDSVLTESGSALPGRSRADAFLRSIRYDYVPAVKGSDYFQRLLSAVYDMLDLTVQNSIRGAAGGFTAEISQHTQPILDELAKRIGLRSKIQLPNDLRRLFSELQFHSERHGYAVTLSQRGDGIKARHIPIILRWLAEQANHLAARGRPRVVTLWGYEEPENNLEMKKSFELANEFLDTSKSIPTFLTTHSPVFYSAFRDAPSSDVGIHEVSFSAEAGTTSTLRAEDQWASLDSSTGLLDLLSPHVTKWVDTVKALQETVEKQGDVSRPTIFVEGPTDVTVLRRVLRTYFHEACSKIDVRSSTSNGGGHGWVKDSLIAWHFRRAPAKAVGLFDLDDAAAQSFKKFKKLIDDHVNGGSTRAYAMKLLPKGITTTLRRKNFLVPVALEELYPAEAWLHAEREGWLTDRANVLALYSFQRTDVSFDNYVRESLTIDIERIMVLKCVRMEYKEKLAKLVARHIKNSDVDWDFEPLKFNVEKLVEKLLGHSMSDQRA